MLDVEINLNLYNMERILIINRYLSYVLIKLPLLNEYFNYLSVLILERNTNLIIPHKYKEKIVKQYAKLFPVNIFIETGTYRGQMIEAVKTNFNTIYSIELDKTIANTAKYIFFKSKNITIINGDSSRVLPKLLKNIKLPCLFWLDAHYSYKTPIIEELKCVLNHSIKNCFQKHPLGHVILIDDSRFFTSKYSKNGYPTIEELKKLVFNINPNLIIKDNNDVIQIYPKLRV